MYFFKKFLKVFLSILLLTILLIYLAFSFFTAPKSDARVLAEFEDTMLRVSLERETFKGFEYRKLSVKNDSILPTVIFVHGAIGSCIDFVRYMKDSTLSKKANFLSYDRVGYNYEDKSNVQASIDFERQMLQNITQKLDKRKLVLVGYSYGGPIVLADTTQYKATVLIAPAVFSKVEPMPWMINFYKWKFTRFLVPKVWQQASREKLSHQKDLQNFEKKWQQNPNKIISIHGNLDGIVPISNSEFLERQFSQKQYQIIKIPDAGHALIWRKFDTIQQQLLKILD